MRNTFVGLEGGGAGKKTPQDMHWLGLGRKNSCDMHWLGLHACMLFLPNV